MKVIHKISCYTGQCHCATVEASCVVRERERNGRRERDQICKVEIAKIINRKER
jgi:hypothetical protein